MINKMEHLNDCNEGECNMRLSILDYVPIFEGSDTTQAINHSVELAQFAESLGFYRFWVAEHHKVLSVASSAPEMIMMTLLENTNSIRIGSGGVMLPHYSAYKVAEVFKILEGRHPGRVDLGIGRSMSFKNVNQALNENKTTNVDFKTQIVDLTNYFNDDIQRQRFLGLYATPLINTQPDMHLLGTSQNSAELAAQLGLPFVTALMGKNKDKVKQSIDDYRKLFSKLHPNRTPYVIISTFVITANDIQKIKELEQAFHLWLLRINYLKQPSHYPSITFAQQRQPSTRELEKMRQNEPRFISGLPNEVYTQLQAIAHNYNADEVMIQPHVYGESNRKNVLQLLAIENNQF